MTQDPQLQKQLIDDYVKLHGFGLCLPGETVVRPPVPKTGDAVKDYIAAAGFGLSKKIEAQD